MVELEKRFERLENLVLCTQKTVLNINELCSLTTLSKSTIYKLTMNGLIPHYKQAKHLFFDRVEIEMWLKKKRGYNVPELDEVVSDAFIINNKKASI